MTSDEPRSRAARRRRARRGAVGACLRRALVAALLVAAWAGAAAEQPTFAVESLTLDQRTTLAAKPALVAVGHQLALTATTTPAMAVLRVVDAAMAPVRTDRGELLAVLARPAARRQGPAEREGVIRVTLDVSPPLQPCDELRGLRGTVSLAIGRGAIEHAEVALPEGTGSDQAPVPGADGGVRVIDRTPQRCLLRLPTSLADRLATVAFTARDGSALPVRAWRPQRRDDDAETIACDVDGTACARVALGWYRQVDTVPITVACERIAVPAGMPGIAGLDVPGDQPLAVAAPPRAAAKPPLLRAAGEDDVATVSRLVAAGADVEAHGADGWRALHQAIAHGDAAMASALLDAHADPDARTRDGHTALHLAIAAGRADLVDVLIAHGAAVDAAVPAKQWSGLLDAVAVGRPELVSLFLRRGDDPRRSGKDGRSAFDLARDLGRWRIMRLLLGEGEAR